MNITITDSSIVVELLTPSFTRFLKLHSTNHIIDEDGLSVALDTLIDADTDNVTVWAISAGSNELYTYTPDGNRNSKSIMAAALETSSYHYYDSSDLLLATDRYAYRYDENGNLIEKGTNFTVNGNEVVIEPQISTDDTDGEYWKYHWDLMNRLIRVEKFDRDSQTLVTVAEYTYDINNLRIRKEDPRTGEVTDYVFDQSGNRIEEHSSNTADYYIWRNGRHLAKDTLDGTFFYSTDHLGSTVLMTDSEGNSVWKAEATPFGDSVADSGDLEGIESLKYTGKDYDEDIGLYYFNARWYEASSGRFISEDPIKDGVSWYVYAGNNPINRIDPSGLREIPDLVESEENVDNKDIPDIGVDNTTVPDSVVQKNQKISDWVLETGGIGDPDQYLLSQSTYVYLYSDDISGEGESWEYTFKEAAYAEAVADGVAHYDPETKKIVANEGVNVIFAEVNNRDDFVGELLSITGPIEKLTVVSHMYETGINLDHDSKSPERLVTASVLDKISANIFELKLSGCNAGGELPIGGTNIAQSFSNKFLATTMASTSGTWFGAEGVVRDSDGTRIPSTVSNRTLIRLVPNGGKWQTFRPE